MKPFSNFTCKCARMFFWGATMVIPSILPAVETLHPNSNQHDIEGHLVWYKADSAQFNSLNDGQPITNWLPESGSSAVPVTVQSPGREILYRKSIEGLNGRPALEFRGGSSMINDIVDINFESLSAFLVFKNNGSGSLQRAVAGQSSNTLLGPWNPSQAGTYNPVIHLNGSWKIHPEDVQDWDSSKPGLLSVVIDGVSVEKSFINGVEIDSRFGGAGPMNPAGIGKLSFNHPAEPYVGYIAEFIVYNRVLSEPEIHKVHGYLMSKYILSSPEPNQPAERITGITATATSELSTHNRVAAHAVDGVYCDGAFWESTGVGFTGGNPKDDPAPAITFDMKEVFELAHLILWNGHEDMAAIKRMTISVSSDGVQFISLGEKNVQLPNGCPPVPQTFSLDGVKARYARLDILESWSGQTFPIVGNPVAWSLVAIDEIEFYGKKAVVSNSAPLVGTQPGSFHGTVGQTAVFSAAVGGVPAPSFQWQVSQDVGGTWTDLSDGPGVTGAQSLQLNLANLSLAMSGRTYRLRATNTVGTVFTDSASLTVQPVPAAPQITRQPQSLAVNIGQTVVFEAMVSGYPTPSHQWQRSTDGGVSWISLDNDGGVNGVDGVRSSVLTLTSVTTGMNSQQFRVRAENLAGIVFSYAAVLTVTPPSQSPAFKDDFNDNRVDPVLWGALVTEGNGQLTETSQRLQYTVSPPGSDYDAANLVRLQNLPAGMDWEVSILVHNALTPADRHAVSAGISLVRPDNVDEILYIELYAGGFLTALETDIIFGEADSGQMQVRQGLVRMSYDSARRVVTTSFDRDGAGSNFGWQTLGTFGLAGSGGSTANRSWNLNASTGFKLAVGAYSEGLTIAAGNVWLDDFALTINNPPAAVPPTITSQPQSLTVSEGSPASFSVAGTGSIPLAYQWYHSVTSGGAEVPVSGGTEAVLNLPSVALAQAGVYRVKISNAAQPGGVFSREAVLTVTPSVPNPHFVNRSLPAAYIPGSTFEVILEAKPVSTLAFYAISDKPPVGWSVSNINEGGLFDTGTGEVKFGPFADNASRSLKYTVSIPATARGRVEFKGVGSADGIETVIGGGQFSDAASAHPADVNSDMRMTINEVTSYGAAWKRGQSWSLPPVSIPINYVTRAGFLWRNGEVYQLDPKAVSAPLWWVAQVVSLSGVSKHSLSGSPSVQRSIEGHQITIHAAPSSGASSYALEERVHSGFEVTGLSHGGEYLKSAGLIRWGPFFDSTIRELTYNLTPPSGFTGSLAFAGLMSEDGDSIPVSGELVLSFGNDQPTIAVHPIYLDGSIGLNIRGPLNARVVIDSTADLGGEWSAAGALEISQPDITWTAPETSSSSALFYRVRVFLP